MNTISRSEGNTSGMVRHSRNHAPALILVFLFTLYLFGGLLTARVFHTHDSEYPWIRTKQYILEMGEGNFPPLLFPDGAGGCGFAFPMYYPPLGYLLSALFSSLLGSVLLGVNLCFFLSVLFSGLFMYGLARAVSRNQFIALVSATIYITVPYRFCDVFVRGALAECWSLVWYPLIFLGIWRLISDGKLKWYFPVSLGALLLSHSVMGLYFGFALVLSSPLVFLYRRWRGLGLYVAGGIVAFFLTCWFTLPQMAYMKDVWVSDKDFIMADTESVVFHRVLFHQLFYTDPERWRGASWKDDTDGMSFELGLGHLVAAMALILALGRWRKIPGEMDSRALFMGGVGVLSWILCFLFLLFPGRFIDFLPKKLTYIQFPWRLLGPMAFFSSLCLAGFGRIPARTARFSPVLIIVSLLLVASVPNYQKLRDIRYDLTEESLTREFMRNTGSMKGYTHKGDYYPVSFPAETIEKVHVPDRPSGENADIQWKALSSGEMDLIVEAREDTRITVPLLYYPFWEVRDRDGRSVGIESKEGFLGFRVKVGKSRYTIRRTRPAPFYIGYFMTITGAILLIILQIRQLRKRAVEQ